MKKSIVLTTAIIALSTFAAINAQSNNKIYTDNNPFLVGKRHGAIVIVNNNSSMNLKDAVYDKNPFLAEKRHGAIIVVNRNSNINPVVANLVANRNPFLAEKRHGAIVFQNANSISKISKTLIEQSFFLRQKRHQ